MAVEAAVRVPPPRRLVPCPGHNNGLVKRSLQGPFRVLLQLGGGLFIP